MFVFILPLVLFRVGIFDLSEKECVVQCSIVQCSIVQLFNVQLFNCSIVQCSIVQCSKEFWELYEKS